jgi:hypothetical protein
VAGEGFGGDQIQDGVDRRPPARPQFPRSRLSEIIMSRSCRDSATKIGFPERRLIMDNFRVVHPGVGRLVLCPTSAGAINFEYRSRPSREAPVFLSRLSGNTPTLLQPSDIRHPQLSSSNKPPSLQVEILN